MASWLHVGVGFLATFFPELGGGEEKENGRMKSVSHKTSFLMKLKPSQGTHLCHLDSSLLASLTSESQKPVSSVVARIQKNSSFLLHLQKINSICSQKEQGLTLSSL